MYVPSPFSNRDINEVRDFIDQNGFAILVNQVQGKLLASHIPLILSHNEEGRDTLTGHVAKGNIQWKAFEVDNRVLAIFSGPHTYISSSWYDHENVPTWNYIAVHVYGNIRIISDDKLRASLKDLVDKYESGSSNPVSIEKMSEGFLNREIRGIVGFQIDIEEIQAAYKLSQNRDEKNYNNIIEELNQRGDHNSISIAGKMRKNRKQGPKTT